MHILTKAFVIIATLLSIGLSALVIAHAYNSDRIRTELQDERARRVSAEGAASASVSQANAEKGRLGETISSLQGQLNSNQSKLSDLMSERGQLLIEKDRAVADKIAAESRINELGELAKTQTGLIEKYREEVGLLRKNELASRQNSLHVEDVVSDMESKIAVYEQTLRQLREELASAKRDGSAGVAGVSASAGSSLPYYYTGATIVGRVETVARDGSSGKTLAKLSVGANDRVQNNMILKIVRGNEFVANVIVQQTDLTFSQGVVDALGRPVEVREGDMVYSRIVQQ